MFQALEARNLLAADLVISEFMAINDNGVQDADGEYSDWIEIHNLGSDSVNLAQWSLTDDADEPAKWGFPDIQMRRGGFLTVFASGKDRSDDNGELHTNFKLASDGEYLALVGPDAVTVHDFGKSYPKQLPDVSYGVSFGDAPIVSSIAPVLTHVPVDDSLGTQWTNSSFNVNNNWNSNIGPIEFGQPTAGFHGRVVRSSETISSLSDADALLSGINAISETIFSSLPVINFYGSGSDGHFGDNAPFPGEGDNNFVVHARATILVKRSQNYTFGTSTDDGTRLVIDGVVVIDDDVVMSEHDKLGQAFLTAGEHELDYVMFQRTRASEAELFVASGLHDTFNEQFSLLGDPKEEGLKVISLSPEDDTSDLKDRMLGNNATAFLRYPFEIDAEDIITDLAINIRYDDGFVAFLNGTEVLRRNAPATATWNSAANFKRDLSQSQTAETYSLNEYLDLLQIGENVLAIHALNSSADDGSLVMDPTLTASGLIVSQARYFVTPTPSEPNGEGIIGLVADTNFSVDRGFYDSAQSVVISSDTPAATIRYTTDGSLPTSEYGEVYTGPITIATTTTLRAAAFRSGYLPSNVDTQTYLFPDDISRQPKQTDGFPEKLSGTNIDYGVADRSSDLALIAGDPRLSDEEAREVIGQSLLALPTMSIVLDQVDLFDPARGIYQNPTQRGVQWERAASVEYILPDGSEGFQINAGLRIMGFTTRNPGTTPKHSLRILFKKEYGDAKLRYPFFEGSPVETFDTIGLRANTADSWLEGSSGLRNDATYMVDQWAKMTQAELGQLAASGRFVHLYLNGVYWGVYNPTERPDASFAAEHLGGEEEDYDAIKFCCSTRAVGGDMQAWNRLMALAAGGLGDQASYQLIQGNNPDGSHNEEFEKLLDIDNLIDYMIVGHYHGSVDWPGNYYSVRRRGPESDGFQFYTWDDDRAFPARNLNQDKTGFDRFDDFSPGTFDRALRANPEYRLKFADHLQKHLFNEGALTPDAAADRWQRIAAGVKEGLIAESARWGDYRRDVVPTGGSLNTVEQQWNNFNAWILDSYFPNRTSVLLDQLRAHALYPEISAATLHINGRPQYGGQVAVGQTLTMEGARRTSVFYTLDGTDPRLLGGAVNPNALQYTDPITLTDRTQVKARVRAGRTWSAIIDATFSVGTPASADNLAISEIYYNPGQPSPEELQADASLNNDDFEFLEFVNIGATPVSLAGVRLTAGIEFEFAADAGLLEPGEHVVIVGSAAAFPLRFGDDISVAGQISSGRLSNSGEELRVEDALGGLIQEFTYNDGPSWPQLADGQGRSLVVIDAEADYDVPSNWRASLSDGGTPGSGEATREVKQIALAGSMWTSQFQARFAEAGLGENGYSILGSNFSDRTAAWEGIDQIQVVFDDDVDVAVGDLAITGIRIPDYIEQVGLVANGFEYDPISHIASWTLAAPITEDHVTIEIMGTTNGLISTDVLVGDGSSNRVVDIRDVQRLRRSLREARYDLFADFDADGNVTIDDFLILKDRLTMAVPVESK